MTKMMVYINYNTEYHNYFIVLTSRGPSESLINSPTMAHQPGQPIQSMQSNQINNSNILESPSAPQPLPPLQNSLVHSNNPLLSGIEQSIQVQ